MSGAQKAIKSIREILPEDRVVCGTEDLKAYDVSNPLILDRTAPTCAVKPEDAAELQRLVKTANKDGISLVPVSSQPPHCKGGTACTEEHVVVDLSSWKKIGPMDRRNRVCMIEPGVTYTELLDALEPRGMTVSMPLAPRSGKSVLASVMDREPSTWPRTQWDVSDPVGSTEFIFGTGDLFRTGAAGGPGTLEKQRAVGGAQKSPMGPSQTDFHRVIQGSQGSMGVVTWITIRTEMKPAVQEPRVVGSDDLKNIIPFVYQVQRPWLGEHSFILDANAAARLMAGDDRNAFKSILESLPRYLCLQNVAGFERLPEERVEYQLKDIEEIASKSGLELMAGIGDLSAGDLLEKAVTPCGIDDWRKFGKGQCLSIFFLTTLDKAPLFIELIQGMSAKYEVGPELIGTYLQPVVQNHSCHIEFMVPYDPNDPAEVSRLSKFEIDAARSLADAGAFFGRPYCAAEKMAFEKNQLNCEVLKKTKNIFDPNRVLNPGKFNL
jgi:FAD/FMN-containing dehydrogenase